jgi:hypothetical protein
LIENGRAGRIADLVFGQGDSRRDFDQGGHIHLIPEVDGIRMGIELTDRDGQTGSFRGFVLGHKQTE